MKDREWELFMKETRTKREIRVHALRITRMMAEVDRLLNETRDKLLKKAVYIADNGMQAIKDLTKM